MYIVIVNMIYSFCNILTILQLYDINILATYLRHINETDASHGTYMICDIKFWTRSPENIRPTKLVNILSHSLVDEHEFSVVGKSTT